MLIFAVYLKFDDNNAIKKFCMRLVFKQKKPHTGV